MALLPGLAKLSSGIEFEVENLMGSSDTPCSRPTAVNLADTAQKLSSVARDACGEHGASAVTVTQAVVAACEAMLQADIAANQVHTLLTAWPDH